LIKIDNGVSKKNLIDQKNFFSRKKIAWIQPAARRSAIRQVLKARNLPAAAETWGAQKKEPAGCRAAFPKVSKGGGGRFLIPNGSKM
jgi:hypothetical protein